MHFYFRLTTIKIIKNITATNENFNKTNITISKNFNKRIIPIRKIDIKLKKNSFKNSAINTEIIIITNICNII